MSSTATATSLRHPSGVDLSAQVLSLRRSSKCSSTSSPIPRPSGEPSAKSHTCLTGCEHRSAAQGKVLVTWRSGTSRRVTSTSLIFVKFLSRCRTPEPSASSSDVHQDTCPLCDTFPEFDKQLVITGLTFDRKTTEWAPHRLWSRPGGPQYHTRDAVHRGLTHPQRHLHPG